MINFKKSKYKAKKVVVDGITFDSKKEARRYSELKLLEKTDLIRDLELQKRYELQAKYKNGLGKGIRKIEYVADFVYYDVKKDKVVVEDVKGYKTDIYKLKKKLFEKQHYPLTITEV